MQVVEAGEVNGDVAEKAGVLGPDVVEKPGESLRLRSMQFEAIPGIKYLAAFTVRFLVREKNR